MSATPSLETSSTSITRIRDRSNRLSEPRDREIENGLHRATVLFAIPRTAGWLAQWLEMIDEPKQRIARPRQVYLGSGKRDFVPITDR